MPEFVRVNHPIFGHFSTTKPDVWGGTVTDDDAVDVNGKPLPAKPRISKAKASTKAENDSESKVE